MRLIAPDGTREWLAVRDYAARLTAADFTESLWPQEDGDQGVYAHLIQTWGAQTGPLPGAHRQAPPRRGSRADPLLGHQLPE